MTAARRSWPTRLGLLRDADYRGLFASTTVSQFGFHISRLGLPLVAADTLSAGAFEVGLLTTLSTLPFLLVGLPAGAWVDRLRRRRVLIAADLTRAAVLATVPAAWWAGSLTLGHLYAVAFALGVGTVFFDVAYQSYLPHLVGRAHLVEGNAKLESVRGVAELGGPALAGQLVRTLGAPLALLGDAVATGLSALFVARIRRREPAPQRTGERRLVAEIRHGLSFVLGNRLLRAIVLCTGTANFCNAAYSAMMVLFLERVVGVDAGAIGTVLAISGAGGVTGALLATRLAQRLGQGPAIWASIACTSPFALLLPLIAAPGWRLWLAACGGFVVSLGIMVYNVTQVSFRQALTPEHLLGRMNATVRFLVWGSMPLGGLLGGTLGELLGVREAMMAAAAGLTACFLPVFLSPLRTMRQLPTAPAPPGESSDEEGSPVGASG